MSYVHDFITHGEEMLDHQGLGEEVGHLVSRREERDSQLTVLDALSNKK